LAEAADVAGIISLSVIARALGCQRIHVIAESWRLQAVGEADESQSKGGQRRMNGGDEFQRPVSLKPRSKR